MVDSWKKMQRDQKEAESDMRPSTSPRLSCPDLASKLAVVPHPWCAATRLPSPSESSASRVHPFLLLREAAADSAGVSPELEKSGLLHGRSP